MKKMYEYRGPIFKFQDIMDSNFIARTYAESKNQAINNILYQFKKKHSLSSDNRLFLKHNLVKEITK